MWLITTGLAMTAAIYGLFNNRIYLGLMPAGFVAAQFSQDILTIVVGVIMLYLILRTNKKSIKEPIIILGILGSLAYLYAIFSFERVYNSMYLIYLAILTSSFYSIVFTISSLRSEIIQKIAESKFPRITNGIFAVAIGVLFSGLWISALLPLMRTGDQIDNLYSIYVLDLVFVMPAFFIVATLSFMKNQLGYILMPAMFILGIFVIFPLGLGELVKPLFNLFPDYKSMVMSFVLSGLFAGGAIWQLMEIKKLN